MFAYFCAASGPWRRLADDVDAARQVVGYNQISRWTVTADGNVGRAGLRARDPARAQGEDRRLAVRLPDASGGSNAPTDSGPGHVGGAGLDFDSEGNLYLGVGDDVSPNASGHSGYAPMDYR